MSIAEAVRDATQDAVNGLRVAVLVESLKSAAELHKAFETTEVGDIPRKFSRANGRLSVDFPQHGGSIVFRSLRSARGLSVDHVYVPANIGTQAMEDVAPAVCASPHGAILGYF